ncbi:MAG: hypothetical protein Rhob2KO_53330 [Rhodopirellula baltica]
MNYRVLRLFLNEHGWPAGLSIKILSAKYGLIDATDLIESYDERLTVSKAEKINKKVLKTLESFGRPQTTFINLGQDYLPAVDGIEDLFAGREIEYADGGIGSKMRHMKDWLHGLTNETATLPRQKKGRSYLYFFPDWDDYISRPFIHEVDEPDAPSKRNKKYAHQIFGAEQTPYDGMLVSLAQLKTGKGALSRLDPTIGEETDLRKLMKVPKRLLMFGDCGAFSYASEDQPPFTPAEAAKLYDRFGFDIGASVDHIPLPEIIVRNKNGDIERKSLSLKKRKERIQLTVDNAEKFLAARRRHKYSFVPLGAIQGIDTRSYVKCVHDYIDMGYRHIALGGLVPRQDKDILEIVCAARNAVQSRTRSMKTNVWLHLFGILRPRLQTTFRLMGISSFDSASYLRKAWLRSDQNYLSPDGHDWYSTIRVPIASSKRMRESAADHDIDQETLAEMELRCLEALYDFDGSTKTRREVVDAVNEYGPLLERRGEDNHFFEKHTALLEDKPWERCRCPVCKEIGIDVVVFRGSGRNKRRGFHNTWVFYHKVLHGKSIPGATSEKKKSK